MIVVSDTGPLHYLLLINQLDVLPRLYGEVVIPLAVVQELSRPASPPKAVAPVRNPPEWLKIQAASADDVTLSDLGDGEQEAIQLARELAADFLLCDDMDARTAAIARSIRVVGTLGVLKEASDMGLVNLSETLAQLKTTNFRVSKSLLETLLEPEDPQRADPGA